MPNKENYIEPLGKYVPEGWGKDQTGGFVVYESFLGKSLAIYFEFRIDTPYRIENTNYPKGDDLRESRTATLREHLLWEGFRLPENIKKIRLISLRPEEMLFPEDRLIPIEYEDKEAAKKPRGIISGVALSTSSLLEFNYGSALTDQPVGALVDGLDKIFGTYQDKENFCANLPTESAKDTIIIIDAHGGRDSLTLGEQKDLPILRDTRTGKLVSASNYPKTYLHNHVEEKTGFSWGNAIRAQDVIDKYDIPDTNVAGMAVSACNEECADLTANNFSLAYVHGLVSEELTRSGKNTLILK